MARRKVGVYSKGLPDIFILLGQTEYGRSGEIDKYIFRVSHKNIYTQKTATCFASFGE
jgi:hypothetical protein